MRASRMSRAVLPVLLAALPAGAAAQAHLDRIETRRSAEAGQYLTDGEGRALYVFSEDQRGTGEAPARSGCGDDCAVAWPPALARSEPEVAEGADPALVARIQRDGGRQLTYGGWPLYRFVGDSGSGEATGHGVREFGGTWHLSSASGGPARSDAATIDPFSGLDLKGPECVRHDRERDRYLVSNINGKMRGADDDGFIMRVGPDGMADPKWIAGGQGGVTLNAPKGMELSDGRLHVADIDHLRVFDAETGEPVRSVAIEGAKFLNDMAIAGDGTVYITDSGTKDVPGAIYRVGPDGAVRAIAKGRELKRPNGIDLDSRGRLIVATFGGKEVLTVTTDGEIVERRQLDAGQLDGLVVREDGSVLVSSWKGKHVVRLSPDGQAETLLTGLDKPACFDVDAGRGLLLVPEVRKNRITIAPLGTD